MEGTPGFAVLSMATVHGAEVVSLVTIADLHSPSSTARLLPFVPKMMVMVAFVNVLRVRGATSGVTTTSGGAAGGRRGRRSPGSIVRQRRQAPGLAPTLMMGGREIVVDAVAVGSVSMMVTAMIGLVTPAVASMEQGSCTLRSSSNAPSGALRSNACVGQLPRIDSDVPKNKVTVRGGPGFRERHCSSSTSTKHHHEAT